MQTDPETGGGQVLPLFLSEPQDLPLPVMAAALWFREGGVARATRLHPSLVPPDSRANGAGEGRSWDVGPEGGLGSGVGWCE